MYRVSRAPEAGSEALRFGSLPRDRAANEHFRKHRPGEIGLEPIRCCYRGEEEEPASPAPVLRRLLLLFREHCEAVFMATEHLQKIWGLAGDTDFLVDRMYDYLYNLYPPLFPEMLDRIDSMDESGCAAYFAALLRDPAPV